MALVFHFSLPLKSPTCLENANEKDLRPCFSRRNNVFEKPIKTFEKNNYIMEKLANIFEAINKYKMTLHCTMGQAIKEMRQ